MEPEALRHRPPHDTLSAALVPPSLVRRARADRRWHPVAPWRAVDDAATELPTDLRSWPPRWRYRVARLEADGMSRPVAVRCVRREAAELTPRAA